MNNKFIKIGSVVVAIIIVLAGLKAYVEYLVVHSSVAGAVPAVTTNLPSLGLNTLVIGNGCGFQSGVPCTGSVIGSSFGLTEGGYELLNATGTAYQLAANDIQNFATVGFIATTSTTITLPTFASMASSTYLPNIGDRNNFELINASSTGGNLTIAAGTGFFLQTNTASSTFTKILVGSSTALFTITRTSPTSYTATMDVYK